MSDEIVDVFHSLQLRDCGGPLSKAVLADWERSIGYRLPKEYRRFLEFFNGGGFYPRFFGYVYPLDYTGTADLPPKQGLGIFTFLSLNEPWDWRDLQSCHDMHEGRSPVGCIPIADAANDLVLLDCRRDGEIVLWSRDCKGDVAPEENRIPLAKSFSEFARGIQRQPREEWLPRIHDKRGAVRFNSASRAGCPEELGRRKRLFVGISGARPNPAARSVLAGSRF